MKQLKHAFWTVGVLGAALLGGFLANFFMPRSSPVAAESPSVAASAKVTLLDVPNVSTEPDEFRTVAVKISDIGTFIVDNSASLIEVTHNGRLMVAAIPMGNGVYFELRVDDTNGMEVNPGVPSGLMLVRSVEAGQYVPSSFTGYWQNLAPGEHTVSMWVRASTSGQGVNALLDPGGWPSNIVIVKEYLPFGATFLPFIQR